MSKHGDSRIVTSVCRALLHDRPRRWGFDRDFRLTVYALCEPDGGAIRYVGGTRLEYLSSRLQGHIREALDAGKGRGSARNSPKVQWVLALARAGKRPAIVPLETLVVADFTAAEARERLWIAVLRERGCDLLNVKGNGADRLDLSAFIHTSYAEGCAL